MWWLFLFLIQPLSCFNISLDLPAEIVGGSIVSSDSASYQVSIIKYSNRVTCSGVIIHPSVIITAAHCVHQDSPRNVSVRVGSLLKYSGGTVHGVRRIVVHELFSLIRKNNDFALLKLSTKIIYNGHTKPLEYREHIQIPPGTLLTTYGWGKTCNSRETQKVLRSVTVPLISDKVCRSTFADYDETMMCAGYFDRKKDASYGDSGGPLVYRNALVGITSFGYGCDEGNAPGVYAKVSSAYKWLKRKLQALEKGD